MTTPQHPINSGFTADSTIAEVLKGIDLTGQLAIVTGGYSGIGTAVTRGLSEAGATVVVPARRPEQARQEIGDVPRVEIAQLDLADLGSVERFAGDFLATDRSVDILVNNAAVMANELTRVGPGGWESQFAIDHLGHFASRSASACRSQSSTALRLRTRPSAESWQSSPGPSSRSSP